MKTTVVALLSTLLLLVCCSGNDKKERLQHVANDFAVLLFNFRYVEAAAYVTPESKKVLEFLSSNIDKRATDSIRAINESPVVTVKEIVVINDTVALAKVCVKGEIMLDSIGHAPQKSKNERIYTFEVVSNRKEQLVRMEAPPRSEK